MLFPVILSGDASTSLWPVSREGHPKPFMALPEVLSVSESSFILAGQRQEDPGVLDQVMIEVQSGEYLGEDDIVRFEDQYGRIK